MVLSSQAGQEIHFESYDKDLDADDFLGRFVPRSCGLCVCLVVVVVVVVVVVFLKLCFKVKVLKVINIQLDIYYVAR